MSCSARPAAKRSCSRRPRTAAATRVEVQTHAWLQAMVGLGDGRSYHDVSPIRGGYRGAAASKVDARVRMHRLNGLS